MSPNDADGMANSVDPDQTAPLGAVWSGSALFAQTCLSENLHGLWSPLIILKTKYLQFSGVFLCKLISLLKRYNTSNSFYYDIIVGGQI